MAIKFDGFDVLGILAQKPDLLKNVKPSKTVAKLDSVDDFNHHFDLKIFKNNLKNCILERTPDKDVIEHSDSMIDFPGIL